MHEPVDGEEQVGQLGAAGRLQGRGGGGTAEPPPPCLTPAAAAQPFTPALLQAQQEISEDVAEEQVAEDEDAEEEEEAEQEAEQERREFGIYQCLPVDDAEPDWESGEAATVEEYLRRVRWALWAGLGTRWGPGAGREETRFGPYPPAAGGSLSPGLLGFGLPHPAHRLLLPMPLLTLLATGMRRGSCPRSCLAAPRSSSSSSSTPPTRRTPSASSSGSGSRGSGSTTAANTWRQTRAFPPAIPASSPVPPGPETSSSSLRSCAGGCTGAGACLPLPHPIACLGGWLCWDMACVWLSAAPPPGADVCHAACWRAQGV